ncbi:hypothetical protein ACFL04_01025 [Patescibacteria group bacterium]
MKNKILKIVMIVLIVVVVILGIRFIAGDEDTWLCQDGRWVKHGVPSAPEPTEPCE